ncbi:MAG: hypothetical protein WCP06_12030 [Verrucomicrobiota bacterium]
MAEFKEIELTIDDIDTEEAEEVLQDALEGLNGIHSARIALGGVHIVYNPLGITADEIVEVVRRAGFTVDTLQETDGS